MCTGNAESRGIINSDGVISKVERMRGRDNNIDDDDDDDDIRRRSCRFIQELLRHLTDFLPSSLSFSEVRIIFLGLVFWCFRSFFDFDSFVNFWHEKEITEKII